MISSNQNVSLDGVCMLARTGITVDEYGARVKGDAVRREVFCAERPVHSAEVYNAAQERIKPERMLLIDAEEYGGEPEAEYEEKRYTIYRTYPREDGLLELYLSGKAGLQ